LKPSGVEGDLLLERQPFLLRERQQRALGPVGEHRVHLVLVDHHADPLPHDQPLLGRELLENHRTPRRSAHLAVRHASPRGPVRPARVSHTRARR
jgi:hypothetical protein